MTRTTFAWLLHSKFLRMGMIVSFALTLGCKPRKASRADLEANSSGAGCQTTVPTKVVYEGDDLVSWVDGQKISGSWEDEVARRENCINSFLKDTDTTRARAYGFNMDHGKKAGDPAQNPALAWDWFSSNPIGFNGVPFVVLKTILDLDPKDHPAGTPLGNIARVWRKQDMKVPGDAGGKFDPAYTTDHIGIGAHPDDYVDGVVLPPAKRKHPLPNGLVYEGPETVNLTAPGLADRILRRVISEDLLIKEQLLSYATFPKAELAKMKVESYLFPNETTTYAEDLQKKNLQKSAGVDEVFFSCSACHQGRVMVNNKMKFLPGMPNTEIEGQYYSKLLMLTAAAMVDGLDVNSTEVVKPDQIKPKTEVVVALFNAMVDKARKTPETFYGTSPAQIRRARVQVINIAQNFGAVMKELIGTGIKTHFIYIAGAKKTSYKTFQPDVFDFRPGQMDAFGVASGLVSIHSRRPDNSFMNFIFYQDPLSPLFKGFPGATDVPSFVKGSPKDDAGKRIFEKMGEWLPQHPAGIDIRSLTFARDNSLANWDGNQDASARTLASGTSATGDPRKVNVRIHEPLNPLINNLPPTPYPFASVDLAKAEAGKAIFQKNCMGCHSPNNDKIYSIKELNGMDENRSLVTSNVSRFGLGSLVFESCVIYASQHKGEPGYNWCMPGEPKPVECEFPPEEKNAEPNPKWCKPVGGMASLMDAYFKDIPKRKAAKTNGYRADVLHGIWGRAPYFHNGSVPTLGHVLCPTTRPAKFYRGNLNYDEKMVGFEWKKVPTQRYSTYETIHVTEFDTTVDGRHNTGHTFGDPLCPKEDLRGKDPDGIAAAIANSDAGKVIEFLKTL